MTSDLLLALGVLLPIVNPVSTSFVFNKLMRGHSKKDRDKVAFNACVTAIIVLMIFLVTGAIILDFFGITIYAFRVAGGIYLAIIGFEMLGQNLHRAPEHYKDNPKDLAIIPIAIPLLSGPGAITSVLVLSDSLSMISVALAILVVAGLSWLALRYATTIDRLLGRTGTNVIERVLGLLVLVIAVQFVFNGITGYIAQF